MQCEEVCELDLSKPFIAGISKVWMQGVDLPIVYAQSKQLEKRTFDLTGFP